MNKKRENSEWLVTVLVMLAIAAVLFLLESDASGKKRATTDGLISEAYEKGHNDGYEEGRDLGYSNGYEDGYLAGDAHGRETGYENGYYDGYLDGLSDVSAD